MEPGIVLLYIPEDEARVSNLRDDLKSEGFRTWFKNDDHLGGQSIEKIREVIDKAGLVLVCLSENSLKVWGSFQEECRLAIARKKRTPNSDVFLIPVYLQPLEDDTFEGLVPVKYFEKKGFTKLVRAIREQINGEQKTKIFMDAKEKRENDLEQVSRDLDRAEEIKVIMEQNGQDTGQICKKILGFKREMRRGGILHSGDSLQGRYKLKSVLGRGGFAEVWLAFDKANKSDLVAVKVLHGQYRKDLSRRERFFRGAQRMKILQHPAVLEVIEEKSEDEGYPYFVMEYMHGGDLRNAVLGKLIDRDTMISIILRIGAALHYAHQKGIIHRDVKPGNILLDKEKNPKLSDFDLVWAADSIGGTHTVGIGSYFYSTPEMMEDGKNPNPAVDVYGLAMTTLFCLHGRDLKPSEIMGNRSGFIENLEIPDPVKTVITRAISWDPADRYQSVLDFCEALDQAWSSYRSSSGDHKNEIAKKQIDRMPTIRWVSIVATVFLSSILIWLWIGKDLMFTDKQGFSFPEPPVFSSPIIEEIPLVGGMKINMVWIPPGEFLMGSPHVEMGRQDDENRHKVKISKGFWMGQTEVTRVQWVAVMGGNLSSLPKPTNPVDDVSWNKADEFIQNINKAAGKKLFRLPTEAEWEYACRAGRDTAYFFGNDPGLMSDHANFCDDNCDIFWKDQKQNDGFIDAAPVGQFGQNAWGLYDMHGNVMEWCSDWYDEYPGEAIDPKGPGSGKARVLRGGSWNYDAVNCRSAKRYWWWPDESRYDYGFRLVRIAD